MIRLLLAGATALVMTATPAFAQESARQPAPSSPAYEPQDALEKGLWFEMDEAERDFRTSKFIVHDPALNAYVRGVLCRTVGEERCGAARIYILRTPQFNASMAPNGAMLVFSGLLLRMRDEAQLAAVLGHEFTHFENRHSLRLFRDMRAKTDLMSWLSIAPVRVPYAAAMATQVAIVGSVYSFSREMEREADAGSIAELVRGGYDPRAASAVWAQLRAEMDATARERRHRSDKDRNGGIFASHPGTGDRMATLAQLAESAAAGRPDLALRAAEYRQALAGWWPQLIADQIALQDFGGTEYLLQTLAGDAADGWTGDLLYARGELYRSRGKPGDYAAAAGFFRQAIATGTAPAESWRGLGLALLKSGQAEEGRAMLRDYLARRPAAEDAAILAAMAQETAG